MRVNKEFTLVVIDGSKALYKAVRESFGDVRIQKCQRHKIENVKSHLPKGLQISVEMSMR